MIIKYYKNNKFDKFIQIPYGGNHNIIINLDKKLKTNKKFYSLFRLWQIRELQKMIKNLDIPKSFMCSTLKGT